MDFTKLLLSSSILCGLALSTACVIVADDDGEETTAGTTPTTDGTDGGTTNDTNDTSDTDDTSDPTTGNETGAAEETGASSSCGWGQTGEDDVAEGYVCGGDGADPDGEFEMECPADLVAGEACGDLSGIGCCDADGNVWFCQDPDGPNGPDEPVLVLEECS